MDGSGHRGRGARIRLEGLDQQAVAGRVEADVVVDQQHEVVPGACDAGVSRGGGSEVRLERDHLDRGKLVPHEVEAAVGRSVVDQQDLIDAGSSLRHSASESSLRGGSATALELAEESKQPAAASMLRNASVSEFEKYGMWGKPDA